MAIRRIEFDPINLLGLLTHYTDGDVPLDAELVNVSVGAVLSRHIGLEVKSDQWTGEPLPDGSGLFAPLHLRYEGRKTLSWGRKDQEVAWSDADNFSDHKARE
jgi:hypothetical protein